MRTKQQLAQGALVPGHIGSRTEKTCKRIGTCTLFVGSHVAHLLLTILIVSRLKSLFVKLGAACVTDAAASARGACRQRCMSVYTVDIHGPAWRRVKEQDACTKLKSTDL